MPTAVINLLWQLGWGTWVEAKRWLTVEAVLIGPVASLS